MASPVIETERLRLREQRIDDFEALHELTFSGTMRVHLGRDPPSQEDSFGRLLRGAGCWHLFGWGSFAVEKKGEPGLVGSCGLFRAMRGLGEDFDPYPEAGWVIGEAHWGQGYAGEAMAAILDWFDGAHGETTVCIISPGNTASERVADKLGYLSIGIGTYKGDEVMRYARRR